jgi:hypothetical protein
MTELFEKREVAVELGGVSAVHSVEEPPVCPIVDGIEHELIVGTYNLEFDNWPFVLVEVLGTSVLGMLKSAANVTVLGKNSLSLIKSLDLVI